MKILIFALFLAFAALFPLASVAAPKQNVAISAFVAENIFSYAEGTSLVVQKNFQRPLLVSIMDSDKNSRQYIETQQNIRVPATPGSTITLTESL